MTDQETSLHDCCDRLQRHDSTLVRIDTELFPVGYGRLLGEALLGSTSPVASLHLKLDTLADATDTETSEEDWTTHPLVHYLRSSATLRTMEPRVESRETTAVPKSLESAILCALRKNPHVETFECSTNLSPSHVAQMWHHTKSIHTWKVRLLSRDKMSVSLRDDWNQALPLLSTNQTLTKVIVLRVSLPHDVQGDALEMDVRLDDVMDSLLTALGSQTALQELRLTIRRPASAPPPQLGGLESLLRSTTSLQRLVVAAADLHRDLLVAALAASDTVTSLRLDVGPLHPALVHFVQTGANRNGNRLAELELCTNVAKSDYWTPDQVVPLLVGSALHSLVVDEVPQSTPPRQKLTRFLNRGRWTVSPVPHDTSTGPSFFDALSTSAVRLERLVIGALDRDSAEALVRYVSSAALRELVIGAVYDDVDLARLVDGLLDSQSLCRVAWKPNDGGTNRPIVLSEEQWEQIRAMERRNQAACH